MLIGTRVQNATTNRIKATCRNHSDFFTLSLEFEVEGSPEVTAEHTVFFRYEPGMAPAEISRVADALAEAAVQMDELALRVMKGEEE